MWLQPMMACALQRGPCSVKLPPPPPPPKKPRKPFPWEIPVALVAVATVLGLIYQYYLYRLRQAESADKPEWRPRMKQKQPAQEQDLPACVQYLIIGTGPAGWAAYQAILKHDHTAKVFFVTKEDIIPYKRYPMSKYMWWNDQPPAMHSLAYNENGKAQSMYYMECKKYMDPVKFFRKPKGPAVSLAVGWCVLRIDADEHIAYIKTSCGERPMYYERCLLAVGSKPKTLKMLKTAPRAVRDRVTTFRTLRDLDLAYRRVREAKHITIIGGGPLAAELSWHISRMHLNWPSGTTSGFEPVKITHLMKDAGMLASIVPGYLAEWASEKLKCQNVVVMPNTQVYDFYVAEKGYCPPPLDPAGTGFGAGGAGDSNKRLQMTLSDGSTMITDYAFLCIGTKPREEIAHPSDLELDEINGGFLANTELEVRKHLYVAGDAVSVWCQWKNERMRFEHLTNAIETGTLAGENMAGFWHPYNQEPHYFFQLGNVLDVEVIGEVGACMPTIALFKPCEETDLAIANEKDRDEYGKPCYKESAEYKNRYKRGILFYLRDDRVVGIAFWNMPETVDDRKDVVTEMLRARPTFKDVNLLADLLGFFTLECDIARKEEEKKSKDEVCIKK